MKKYLLLVLIISTNYCLAQSKDETAIHQLLNDQTRSWNRGNIDSFMLTYWQSDSLMFIGKNGITYGWTNTLNNYKKNYPDLAAMGRLSFEVLLVRRLSSEYFQVIGKWNLQRSIGDLSGHYTLLLKKINGNWLIIADHSS